MSYLVLVVDDQDYADTLVNAFKEDGHETSVVARPAAVLRKITEHRPDLLLLDVIQPEDKAAAINLARAIRRSERLSGLPILLITGPNDEYPFKFGVQDLESEWFPVSGFLEKPVELTAIRKKVAELLEKAGLRGRS